MERLTKDKDYQDLKDICEGLESIGQTPALTHLRYIRLAEYEQTGLEPSEIKERLMSEALKDLEGKYWECNRQIALYDDEVKSLRTKIFDEIIKRCEGCYSRSFEECKGYECIMHHCLACVDGDRWLKTMNANPGFQKWWEDKQDES